MKNTRRFASGGAFFAIVVVVCCSSVFSNLASGQGTQGQNTICTSTSQTGCPTNMGSSAFIDASMFIGNGNKQSSNVCGALYGILSSNFYSYPATGAVIDARDQRLDGADLPGGDDAVEQWREHC